MAQQPKSANYLPKDLNPKKLHHRLLANSFPQKIKPKPEHQAQHQPSRALKNTEFSMSRVGLVLEETNMSSLGWQVGKIVLKK